MKRLDFVIIAAALLLGGLLFLFAGPQGQPRGAAKAEIYVAGALMQTLPLDRPEQLWIEGIGGKILMSAGSDGVWIAEADCPSQDCVHTGKITASGQMIACLPNRILIKLAGISQDGEVDAVAR